MHYTSKTSVLEYSAALGRITSRKNNRLRSHRPGRQDAICGVLPQVESDECALAFSVREEFIVGCRPEIPDKR